MFTHQKVKFASAPAVMETHGKALPRIWKLPPLRKSEFLRCSDGRLRLPGLILPGESFVLSALSDLPGTCHG